MHSQKLAIVRHQAFDDVTLILPIDWRMDPFHSKSWQHHFMSLRWVTPSLLGDNLLILLRSFYNFHCVKAVHNPYYSTLRGDHTASIRLKQLGRIKQYFESKADVPGVGLCNRLILAEIENLQNPNMYRKGHNHGLMVDIALLDVYEEEPRYRTRIDRDAVLERGFQTLKEMFDPVGITREHSISYQEHNYPLARDFLRHYGASRNESYAPELTANTKRLLSFARRDCGEYIPLGDSVRQVNAEILRSCPEIDETSTHRAKIGQPGNRSFCAGGMFFYKRSASTSKKLHLGATCAWNSHNHKQDDELSFCLEVNGVLIFDDPGYTVYKNSLDVQLRGSDAHSTVTIEGAPFCDRTEPPIGSDIHWWRETADGFRLFAQHRRIGDFTIGRHLELDADTLILDDTISSNQADFLAKHTFVLGPTLSIDLKNEVAHLIFQGIEVAKITPTPDSGKWQISEHLYVGANRFQYEKTKKIQFCQRSQKHISFKIEF